MVGVRSWALFAYFALLIAWAIAWPYPGDGDSALHFVSINESFDHPPSALTAWARPGFVALVIGPALAGPMGIRIAMAFLAVLLVAQTAKLADTLKMRHGLLAGLFVAMQPLAFALSSDAMTEIPFALVTVLALRAWFARRWMLSSLLVSFLPLIRPEGFFLGLLWTGLVLGGTQIGGPIARLRVQAVMATGLLVWFASCFVVSESWTYFIELWSWPAQSPAAYGTGPLLHHVKRWPEFCGPILIFLFVAGLPLFMQRRFRVLSAIWLMVFGLHSILYWGGWFASCGLMRIMVSIAPITALVCLHGWNSIGRWTAGFTGQTLRKTVAAAVLFLAVAWPLYAYAVNVENHRCFPVIQLAEQARASSLLEGATHWFCGDQMIMAELGLHTHTPGYVANGWNRQDQLAILRGLPVGAVGFWDNQRATQWHRVSVEELLDEGFAVQFEASMPLEVWPTPWREGRQVVMRYVAVRKLR